jgi:hypothetical protein
MWVSKLPPRRFHLAPIDMSRATFQAISAGQLRVDLSAKLVVARSYAHCRTSVRAVE